MRPQIHWIDATLKGRLAIMPRPRAGDWLEDEIAGWRAEGIDVVVSLLEPDEVSELGLQCEAVLCTENAMKFLSFPISDRGVPASLVAATALVRKLALDIDQGKAVAIHCRAGIGRSALIAACAMALLGVDLDHAFKLIGNARGTTVPDTEEQRDWACAFRDHVLARSV